MKYLYTLLFVLLLCQLNGQTINRGFAFQGYARNADGSAVSDQSIQVKFSIFPNGSAVQFEETQTVQTDAFGIFVADIGTENDTDFEALQFESFDYFLKVEVALTGGNFVEISNKQLKSVPYAQSAVTAVSAINAVTAQNGVPAGTILPFAGPESNVPEGYVICNGTEYDGSSDTYASLFDAIGTNWGGSGTNFRVPDLRGYFLRGVAGTEGTDPDKTRRDRLYTGGNTGNVVGTYQNDALKKHSHGVTDPGHKHDVRVDDDVSGENGIDENDSDNDDGTSSTESSKTNITIDEAGESIESRPKNAYVHFIIKL